MKIRSGFVSNSSSSSFIIAVKDTPECPCCHRRDANFIDWVGKVNDPNDYECTKLYARGADDVISWWKDNIGYDLDWEKGGDDSKLEKRRWDDIFEKVKQSEKDGWQVGSLSIGYHDELTNDEWNNQKRKNTVKVIYTDH